MTAPLSKLAPTLSEYGPLDCGLLRIGGRWMVFVDDRVYVEETYPTRLAAIDALYHAAMTPSQRAQDARQSGMRG